MDFLFDILKNIISSGAIIAFLIWAIKRWGEWKFLQKYNAQQFLKVIGYICEKHKDSPKLMEKNYSTLILLSRLSSDVLEGKDKSIGRKKIYAIDTLKKLHEKSFLRFSDDQNDNLYFLIDLMENFNARLSKLNPDPKDKQLARNMVSQICFIIYQVRKVKKGGEKFTPFSPFGKNDDDFNRRIREQLGISIDEEELFQKALAERNIEVTNEVLAHSRG